MWLIGHYIQVSRQKQYGWSMPCHRPVGRLPRYAPRELCQRRGLDRDQLQRVRPGQDQRLLRPTTSLSISRLRSCQDRESTLREQWETLYEEAKALGLDSSQFPPLPELFRQFLDIEPQVWRRGEALREQLREHCVLPGMRVPSEVDIDGVKGAKEAPSDGSEQTFDYDLFIRWLGFQNKDEAMAYFEERRHRRRRDRQLRRLLGSGLMLLAALGHFGVLARAAQRVPGGLVTALALSATLDATLVTTCLMIAMPLLLLLWDLVSAPVARRFDPRRIQAYRATDAVRRLLFMYIFMVWPLLGSGSRHRHCLHARPGTNHCDGDSDTRCSDGNRYLLVGVSALLPAGSLCWPSGNGRI
ncbi:hypothetical protein F1559_000329 [Cyanidiococcus yangmingshanensis]|uniref:Uncharacterized protein n=1 Tax=Cyanidiococcus yangmingshanensis TaxID=2690220 RepID=A0A7J7IHX0_9RHOD|nr:hypothetical protein F1559_000329 [Cyanidiococcus yangmingshanensis]